MISTDVLYTRQVWARGGRKSPNSRGIQFTRTVNNDNITIYNLNAKDGKVTTDLYLTIPKEDIDKVIEALKQFK